jgi:hypothetical protein
MLALAAQIVILLLPQLLALPYQDLIPVDKGAEVESTVLATASAFALHNISTNMSC